MENNILLDTEALDVINKNLRTEFVNKIVTRSAARPKGIVGEYMAKGMSRSTAREFAINDVKNQLQGTNKTMMERMVEEANPSQDYTLPKGVKYPRELMNKADAIDEELRQIAGSALRSSEATTDPDAKQDFHDAFKAVEDTRNEHLLPAMDKIETADNALGIGKQVPAQYPPYQKAEAKSADEIQGMMATTDQNLREFSRDVQKTAAQVPDEGAKEQLDGAVKDIHDARYRTLYTAMDKVEEIQKRGGERGGGASAAGGGGEEAGGGSGECCVFNQFGGGGCGPCSKGGSMSRVMIANLYGLT